MVYTPYTWSDYEVIFDSSLNNMETGIANAEKWSNEIIDSDKDMQDKGLSNLNYLGINSVYDTSANGIAVPSQTLQYSKDTETSAVLTAAYTLINSITLGATHPGSANGFLVKCEVKTTGTTDVIIQLRSNDVVIYEITQSSLTTYEAMAGYALALAQGDKISVYMLGPSVTVGYVKNFRLYADYKLNAVGVDGGSFS